MTSRSIDADLCAAIRRLAAEATLDEVSLESRDAAIRTGGLPVYADLGGVLVIAASGEVLRFDAEADSVTVVNDERWRAFAFVRASRKFPELSELRPARPVASMSCPQCSGEGTILDGIECGKCYGLGWLETPAR
jgi:hypothetical protein